jgi:hypothetical protein
MGKSSENLSASPFWSNWSINTTFGQINFAGQSLKRDLHFFLKTLLVSDFPPRRGIVHPQNNFDVRLILDRTGVD